MQASTPFIMSWACFGNSSLPAFISGMAQPDAGSSEGRGGISGVWRQTTEELLKNRQVKSAHWALGSCQWEGHRDQLKKSVSWSSKTLILMFFLVQAALSGSCQFVYFIKYEKHTTWESEKVNICFKGKGHLRYIDTDRRVNWTPADGSRLHFNNVLRSFLLVSAKLLMQLLGLFEGGLLNVLLYVQTTQKQVEITSWQHCLGPPGTGEVHSIFEDLFC